MKETKPAHGVKSIALRLSISLMICALAVGAKYWYPETAQTLRDWIVGPEDNRVSQAFAALNDNLSKGSGIGTAVQAFYEEMSGHEES